MFIFGPKNGQTRAVIAVVETYLFLICFTYFTDVKKCLYVLFLQIEHDNKMFAVGIILLDGLFNMLQNVFAFTVLAMVNPLSYAVANATKRVVIIGASLLLLRNPVTMMNVVGMLIAVFGVLLYNWVRFSTIWLFMLFLRNSNTWSLRYLRCIININAVLLDTNDSLTV